MSEKHSHTEIHEHFHASTHTHATKKQEEEISHEIMHPADIAEHIENLPFQEQISFLKNMSPDNAAEAIAELDEEHASDVLESLTHHEAAAIISEMAPDDAVDVLDEIDEEHRENILKNMDFADAEELKNLMNFDSETAAGLMNTEILLLAWDITPDFAIQKIRSVIDDIENIYYVYLVDNNDILCDIISMRDLMRLPRNTKISENNIEKHELITVPYDMDRKDLAQVFAKYNFLSIPVVDRENRVLGVVTHDDVIDIIHDEASADMLGMVGAGQYENIDTDWKDSVKMRFPWLVINLLNSTISASVVYCFNGSIEQMAILAVLMPIVANQAGNTGQQALAVMIRQLAMETFNAKKAWFAVLREMKIGILSSILLSIFAFIGVSLLFQNIPLAVVMSLALIIDMILGAVCGASIPLVLRTLGRDPAQASSIFLTTITDSMGFFIFLGLATIILF